MKKKVMALVLLALMVTGLVGCGSDNNASKSEEGKLKVGMVTDTGLMINRLTKVHGKELRKQKRVLDLKQLLCNLMENQNQVI